jgi:hypothetical protein
MKSTITLRIGSKTLSLRGSSRRELSTVAASLICSQPTLPDLLKSISSLASADGRSLHVSQGGRTIARYGQGHAHVSRSALPGSKQARQTFAISGPSSIASSTPAVLLSSWENRLRQRLANLGSTECVLTWKESATPQGRPLSRLVPSTRPTDATDCGLWPTATSRDWKDGPPCANVETNALLGRTVWLYPTPSASMMTEQDMAQAMFAGNDPNRPAYKDARLSGPIASGSPAMTEKPGALNPEFVSWLMGFPPEWVNCAPSGTRSSRKSRPK